jgi:FlaA1/EpsC-like NDP-sugar epimerase
MVQHVLKFDPVDVLVKSADEHSYNTILEELKEKEIYNMIIDLHDKKKMNMFLKSVR